MLMQTGPLYEFGGFRLNLAEKTLLRGDQVIGVTPKVFETLRILVENAGHLVEKDELMQQIWQDRFVEESNLTFNIKMVRRALGDDATRPRFIETLHGRGYRFIADVTKSVVESALQNETKPIASTPIERNSPVGSKFKWFLIPVAAILCIGAIASGLWYARNKNLGADAPVLSAAFSSEKLSTNGKVFHAIISPDGKNVAYTNGMGSDKESVWVRQLDTSNNVQIIPPSNDFYFSLAFSPDGNFLYFSRKPKSVEGQADIYRISIFGGIPTRIVGHAQGWISISPDGGKISFVRCYYTEDEHCSLWIADAADGKNEKKLVARPYPFRIGDNKISPDGRTVAFAVGQSRTAANEFGLAEVDIDSGAVRELTGRRFFNIKSLAWLPNQSGLLITALEYPDKNFRIWKISGTTGDASPLTKDAENYSALCLDRDAKLLVATQVKSDFRLNLYQGDDVTRNRRALADATTVAFAPSGKIIFTSAMTGNPEMWSINADGSEQRQLTNDGAEVLSSAVSPDNKFIFFGSNRTGETHVWRMNIDGSNQTQITRKEGGFPIYVSPDGKWVYYNSALQKTLMRIAADGGKDELVLDKRSNYYALSPDGSRAAFSERLGDEMVLTVVTLDDRKVYKTFKLPSESARFVQVAWSPDGRNLFYVLMNNDSENNALWMQPLDRETPRQIADLGDEQIGEMQGFALSPDGKSFAIVQGDWKHDAVLLKGLR